MEKAESLVDQRGLAPPRLGILDSPLGIQDRMNLVKRLVVSIASNCP